MERYGFLAYHEQLGSLCLGSRQTGNLGTGPQMEGNPVTQDLDTYLQIDFGRPNRFD